MNLSDKQYNYIMSYQSMLYYISECDKLHKRYMLNNALVEKVEEFKDKMNARTIDFLMFCILRKIEINHMFDILTCEELTEYKVDNKMIENIKSYAKQAKELRDFVFSETKKEDKL